MSQGINLENLAILFHGIVELVIAGCFVAGLFFGYLVFNKLRAAGKQSVNQQVSLADVLWLAGACMAFVYFGAYTMVWREMALGVQYGMPPGTGDPLSWRINDSVGTNGMTDGDQLLKLIVEGFMVIGVIGLVKSAAAFVYSSKGGAVAAEKGGLGRIVIYGVFGAALFDPARSLAMLGWIFPALGELSVKILDVT